MNVALFLGGFTVFVVLYCVQPLIHLFMETFQISETRASLALSISTITLAISLLFYGALSETFGRRKIMIGAVILVNLFSFAQPFVQNIEQLLVLRAIQGVFLGGLPAVAVAFISEEVHPSQIVQSIGLFIGGNGLGSATGRMGSALLSSYFGWEIALFILSCVGFVTTVTFCLMLPKSRNFKPQPLRMKPVLFAYRSHITNRKLLPLFMTGFLLMACNVAIFNFIGIHLIEAPFNWSEKAVGFIYGAFFFGSFSTVLIGPILDRKGESWAKRFAIAVFVVGALFTLLPFGLLKLVGVTVSIIAFFIGHSLSSGAVGKLASHHKSQASSLYLLFYYTGSSIGGVVASFGWTTGGWTGVIALVIGMLTLAFILTFKMQVDGMPKANVVKNS